MIPQTGAQRTTSDQFLQHDGLDVNMDRRLTTSSGAECA